MSLPLPHIQALSTYKTDRQTPPPLRNSSSPFSLAIPTRHTRSVLRPPPETSSLRLPPIRTDDASPLYLNSTELAEFPKRPKKAVLISEQPVFPPTSPYKHTTKSTSTISLDNHHTTKLISKPLPLWKKPINDRLLATLVTVAIAVFLAITIPVAVIVPQRYVVPLPINILLPFYMDPVDGSWQRLIDTVVKHHDTNFTIILNPHLVPGGNSSFPSTTYTNAVKSLNPYSNVCTVGYIDTQYGRRENASVRAEIAYYAGWKNISSDLALHGVYFDHTPWDEAKNGSSLAYLKNVTETARHTDGWADGRMGLVVQNPGRMANASMMEQADITVVWDELYADLPSKREGVHDMVKDGGMERERLGMMVHGTPGDFARGGLRSIVELVRRDVEWMFVTDAVDGGDGYASFWDDWMDVLF